MEIETILEGVFAADPFDARVEDPNALLLVAEREVDGENRIVGFVDLELVYSHQCDLPESLQGKPLDESGMQS